MLHVVEVVTALLGCCAAALGSICVFRLGHANECTPPVERLSWWLMVIGTVAVGTALLTAAWFG